MACGIKQPRGCSYPCFVACEAQTHFRSSRGREATTGNASALRRLSILELAGKDPFAVIITEPVFTRLLPSP